MLTTLPVFADVAAVLALSDRTEIRARAPGAAPPTTSIDLETAPELKLTLASPRMHAAFAYVPRLTFWDLNVTAARPLFLHGGLGHLDWNARHARLSLDENASYGAVNLAAFTPTPGADGTPGRVDVVPVARVIDFVSSVTTLASRLTFDPWTVDLSTGYQLGGGSNAEARAVLPFQAGPFAAASFTDSVTRTDQETTMLSAAETSFSSGPESLLTEADEKWRHMWSRVTETSFTLGVSEASARMLEDGPRTLTTYPVVEADFEQHVALGGRLDVRLHSRLGPAVNRLFGNVDERIQGSLVLLHTYKRFISHAYVSAAETVPESNPFALRVVSGELGASYETTPVVILDCGVRGLWQHQDPDPNLLWQVSVFLGLTLRAPPIKM